MEVAAGFGEEDLTVAFAESFGTVLGQVVDALGTAHAFFVNIACSIVVVEHTSTPTAQRVIAGL